MPKIDPELNRRVLERIAPDIRAYLGLPAANREPPAPPADPKAPTPRVSLQVPPVGGNSQLAVNFFYEDLLAACAAAGIGLAENRIDDSAYFLVLLGIPDQATIDALLTNSKPRWLIVLAMNEAEIPASLNFVDWAGLNKRFTGGGGGIAFGFEADPKRAAALLRHTFRAINPMAIDGFAYWAARHDQATIAMHRELQNELLLGSLYFDYLGEFFDESVMLRTGHENICRHGGRFYARREITAARNVPFVVIATGPSLDREFDNLKRIKDRVILVSCGSAVQPLIAQGIQPDIHIENENINVAAIFQHVHDKQALKEILSVVSTTVDPTVRHELGEVILFLRHNHSAYPLFAEKPENALLAPEPSVLNAALSFVQEIGATDIHFVGTDLGKKSGGEHHHSRFSYHYIDGSIPNLDLNFSIPVPGVGGEPTVATQFLYVVREQLEDAIRRNGKGRTYTNHSHGARIAGTAELPLAAFDPKPLPRPKDEILGRIRDSFPPVSGRQTKRWDETRLQAAIDAYASKLAGAMTDGCNEPANDRMDRLLGVLGRSLDLRSLSGKGADDAVRMLFRGTAFLMLSLADMIAARASKPDQCRRIAADAFARHVAHMAAYAKQAVANPAPPYLPPDRPKGAARATAATMQTLKSRISRNSPCPCGSGEAYKRCHGRLR